MNHDATMIETAVLMPHPPLLIPAIGKQEIDKIRDVDQACLEAARRILEKDPETVIIASPHSVMYADYFQILSGKTAHGSFAQFGYPQEEYTVRLDTELADAACRIARDKDFPLGKLGRQDGRLDHGVLVPLHFLQRAADEMGKPMPAIVRVSLSGLSNLHHARAGQILARAIAQTGRKAAFIASGDLSHCQKADTHYGFKQCGVDYDKEIMDLLEKGDFVSLVSMPEKKAEQAMSCGHKSLCIEAGLLDHTRYTVDVLTHSAEFGVGYGIAVIDSISPDDDHHMVHEARARRQQMIEQQRSREDAYIALARQTIEEHVTGHPPVYPPALSPEMMKDKAGVFVSLHKDGQLRGCIGTIAPVQENIAMEIIHNAISACSRDPRFYPVRADELEDLEISVDVLMEPENIDSMDQLDVTQYGVIVTKNGKRGLLLPNLEGIDTPAQQVAIAKEKAGLDPMETGCSLQRFQVIRHEVR